MKKFRIKVDLSAFFDDERKFVYMLVDPNWEDVQCLQKRIEEIFGIDNFCLLTEDKYFLPPQESIEVIRSSDVLKAFIPSTSKSIKKKQKSKHAKTVSSKNEVELSKILEDPGSVVDPEYFERLKKRKFKSLGLACASSTPNHTKRQKNTATLSLEIPIITGNQSTYEAPTSTSENFDLLNKLRQANKLEESKMEAERNLFITGGTASLDNSTACNSPLKKVKRKKNINSTFRYEEEPSEKSKLDKEIISDSILSKTSSTLLNDIQSNENARVSHTRIFSSISTKSHLYLDEKDNGCSMQATPKEYTPHLLFFCKLHELTLNYPRVFSLKKLKSTNLTEGENVNGNFLKKKPLVEIQEHIVIPQCNLSKVAIKKCDKGSTIVEDSMSDVHKVTISEDTKKENNETAEEVHKETITKESEPSMEKDLVPRVETSIADHESKATVNTQNADQTGNDSDDSSVIALDSEEEGSTSDEKDIGDCGDKHTKEKNRTKNKREQRSPDVSEVIDLNATDEESDYAVKGRKDLNRREDSDHQYREFIKGNKSIKDILPFTTALNELPSIGDIVLFKIRCLDDRLTDYIAGKCEYANKRVKNIKLVIIDGLKTYYNIPNKYKCSMDDSNLTDSTNWNIKINEMIHARIFQT